LATAAPAVADTALPASSGTASITNDTLSVLGTSASDRIALRLAAGDAKTLQVDFGDDGSAEASFDRGTFSAIEVSLLSGDDQLRVDQVNGSFVDEALSVDGGSGDDTFLGGDGNEVFFGGSGRDFADGNRGHDAAFLGSGEDTFQWDPGDGSDDVDGGSAKDSLIFNGANVNERMSLFADGSRSVFLRDPGSVRMNMDDVELLDLHALGGADALTIGDMTGTELRDADVDLGANDGQIDDVTLTGTDTADHVKVRASDGDISTQGLRTDVRISAAETTDRLHVNTLDGNDHVRVDDDAAALISVAVDLGAGQH
jgi:Ca2+-binding RTX toxin-like protein